MTIYLDLTREFNRGDLRAIICSGQAVVLHRLAIMSKDGDWIVREDKQSLQHLLGVLAGHGARYRFGAPLDARWLAGGWSSHFEFRARGIRVRTDFFSRPPRISTAELSRTWSEQEGRDPPFVNAVVLADMKKTNREKDYVVIGELARLMPDVRDQLLYSRSARDLIELVRTNPAAGLELAAKRPLLAQAAAGREKLEVALDAERRSLIRTNERRLEGYLSASSAWAAAWPDLAREVGGLALPEAHRVIVERATTILPTSVETDDGNQG